MAKASKNLQSLVSLDREIHRLSLHSRKLEGRLDDNLKYLQDHYSSLMIKSVFPVFQQKGGIPGAVLNLFLQNRRLQEKIAVLGEQVLDKVADGLEFVLDKLGSRQEPGL